MHSWSQHNPAGAGTSPEKVSLFSSITYHLFKSDNQWTLVIEGSNKHFNTNLKDERIPIRRKSFLEKYGSFKISTQDKSNAIPSTEKKKNNH
jgi:hypothetical protein